MGQIMVYRYRPMRVFPTMTTRVVISRGSFCVRGHYVWLTGASTGKEAKFMSLGVKKLT